MRVWGYPTRLLGKMQQMEAGIRKTASHGLPGQHPPGARVLTGDPFASLVSSNLFLPLLFPSSCLSFPFPIFSTFFLCSLSCDKRGTQLPKDIPQILIPAFFFNLRV